GDTGAPVQLVPVGRPPLAHCLVAGADRISLADWRFTPSVTALSVRRDSMPLTFTAERGGARVTLAYVFFPDEYRFQVRGEVIGLGPAGAVLLVGMGDGLRSVEADTMDDFRHFAVVTKAAKTQSIAFQSLKPGTVKLLDGPFEWAGFKSKSFLAAALALEQNPDGGVVRPMIQPVSILVVNILIWMHDRLSLAYGWVLVIFGILVRALLWPLNQKAMESSIRMQAVAPLIKETQERYKNDPERLQREMMRLYKEHHVNPLGGCLPMLIPMPVLFALFFVFANTIEFRGVAFLWLPDLSRADPYYIIPVVMGLSMFVLSKVGQIGVPPNPQTKTMLYFMPVFMTLLLLRFASGLNLYYAVSNIFSIPQQYLIARRRLRDQGKRT